MYNQIIEMFIAAQHAARQAYQDAAHFEREVLAGKGTAEPLPSASVPNSVRKRN